MEEARNNYYYNDAYQDRKRGIKSLKDLAMMTVTMLEVRRKPGYRSLFELKNKSRTMEALSIFLNIPNQSIDNAYVHGSRVWGTSSRPNSDWDLIVVTTEAPLLKNVECGIFGTQFINATIYDTKTFMAGIAKQSLELIPCLFLPPQFVLRECTPIMEGYRVEPKALISDAMNQFKRAYFRAIELCNSDLFLRWDLAFYPESNHEFNYAKKCAAHAIRYLLFCIQLLEQHKLYDLTQSHKQWSEIMGLNEVTQLMQFLQFDFKIMISPLLTTIVDLAERRGDNCIDPKDVMLAAETPLIIPAIDNATRQGRDRRVHTPKKRPIYGDGKNRAQRVESLKNQCLRAMVRSLWEDSVPVVENLDYKTMNCDIRSLIIGFLWRSVADRAYQTYINPQIHKFIATIGLEDVAKRLSFSCWANPLVDKRRSRGLWRRNDPMGFLCKPNQVFELPIGYHNWMTKTYKEFLVMFPATPPEDGPHIAYFIDKDLAIHRTVLPESEGFMISSTFIWKDLIILQLVVSERWSEAEPVIIYKIKAGFSVEVVRTIKGAEATVNCGDFFFIGRLASDRVITATLIDSDVNIREIDIVRTDADDTEKGTFALSWRSCRVTNIAPRRTISVEVEGFLGRYLIDTASPSLTVRYCAEPEAYWLDVPLEVTMISPDTRELETLTVEENAAMTLLRNKAGKEVLCLKGAPRGEYFGFKNLFIIIAGFGRMYTYRGTKLIAETGMQSYTVESSPMKPEGWKHICVSGERTIALYDVIPSLAALCVQVLRDQIKKNQVVDVEEELEVNECAPTREERQWTPVYEKPKAEGWLSDINCPNARKLSPELRIRLFSHTLLFNDAIETTLSLLLNNNVPTTIIYPKDE